ncbi:hypothetical protein H6775_03775 [Candidatus Nomurabacteria bacterium]|nr:hypothetical protein [Candidatus Nomurabacteria bacterium]
MFAFGINSYSKGCAIEHSEYGYYSQHAEYACIKKRIGRIPKNCTLLVIRLNGEGELVESSPCSKCKKFLQDHGIKKVFASNDEGEIRRINIGEKA